MIAELNERGALIVRLNASIYSEAVVFKCLYWYGAEYQVEVTRSTGGAEWQLLIGSSAGSAITAVQREALVSRLRTDLLDFKTREIVSAETGIIRDLLVAKAFAATDDWGQGDAATHGVPSRSDH